MASKALVRLTSSIFWELRRAWASGRRVAITLTDRCDRERVEGHVVAVSATDAYVRVKTFKDRPREIPGEDILAVHNPSRLGDSTVAGTESWTGRPLRVEPQLEQIPGIAA